jgi:L-lactate dehydrogenase complex protein LldG
VVAVAVSGDARAQILHTIRSALAAAPPAPEPPGPPPPGPEPGDPDHFAARVADYSATVTRCGGADAEIGAAVAEACARHDARRLAVPADLPAAWIPDAAEALPDEPPLTVDDLDGADGALTGAAAAIAETGTIVLDGGAAQGRRALSLVPDLHVCVVRAADIAATVPALFALLGESAGRRPVTFISGPSATSDIELRRVEGVHGPRRLEVVIAG